MTLLVVMYCLGCNSGAISVTRMESIDECEISRLALLEAYPADKWLVPSIEPDMVKCVQVTK